MIHGITRYNGFMLLIREPNSAKIERFLRSQDSLPFTYSCVGGTRSETFPPGYTIDRNRIVLGQSDAVWRGAVSALQAWTMFRMPWCRLAPVRPSIAPGSVVAVAFRHYGIWSLNSARVVYRIDEPDRYGFAYGTLPGHSESGEERFLIERSATGEIYYDLLAFSRPRDLLPRLASTLARRLQRRFVLDSQRAMSEAAAR